MTQINLTIPDMHCNGCLRAITRLAQKLDPQAQVSADLPARQASFTGALDEADRDGLGLAELDALADAGAIWRDGC